MVLFSCKATLTWLFPALNVDGVKGGVESEREQSVRKRGREAGTSQGDGKREKLREKITILRNVKQLKGAKRRELTKIGQEPGMNYTRRGILWTPVSPPPAHPHKTIYPSTKTIRLRGRVVFNEVLLTITRRKLGRVVQNFYQTCK